MIRYYLSKGHTSTELLNLSFLEKTFYINCMETDIEEEIEKYNAMFGAK